VEGDVSSLGGTLDASVSVDPGLSVVEIVEWDTKIKEYVVVRKKLWAHVMTVRMIFNALYSSALFPPCIPTNHFMRP